VKEPSSEKRESAVALEPFLTVRPEGLRAEAFGAVLDPSVPVARAILSHAHADHAVDGHGEVWATPETLALYRRRHPAWAGTAKALPYEEEHEENGVRIRLVPAGHILGSAQMLFSGGTQTLLYTGDFKRRAARTAAAAEAPRASVLLTETTFGLPVFRFPPAAELERRLLAACRDAIAEDETPVLLAYSLGKAQEAAAILTDAGIPSVLHGAAWNLLPEFAAAGISLPLSRAYESGPPVAGEVLITPPSTARTEMVRRIRRRRTVYLSGWAVREAARAEFDADVLIPMSDHADFDDLLEHVREVAPRRVVTLHGFAPDFARLLDARGVPAEPLTEREERPAAEA
jgi:putative mRNA 3-end processing factor